MQSARIAELLGPFLAESGLVPAAELSLSHLGKISTYVDMLLRWNARMNLTSVRDPEEIVSRHFGESLFAARHVLPTVPLEYETRSSSIEEGSRGGRVIDIGSGAGFPGLPMKIWATYAQVELIEANQKKAAFLREVIRALQFEDVAVFASRVEQYPPPSTVRNIVTLRAVEHLENLLPIALRLAGTLGSVTLLVGDSQVGGICRLTPHTSWTKVPVPMSARRFLLVGRNLTR